MEKTKQEAGGRTQSPWSGRRESTAPSRGEPEGVTDTCAELPAQAPRRRDVPSFPGPSISAGPAGLAGARRDPPPSGPSCPGVLQGGGRGERGYSAAPPRTGAGGCGRRPPGVQLKPSATHPGAALLRAGSSGAAPVRAGWTPRTAATELPALGRGRWGLWFAEVPTEHARGPLPSPPGAPPSKPTRGPSPLPAATARPTHLRSGFKHGAAGAARAAIGRFEKGSARSPCPVHPGGCSPRAWEEEHGWCACALPSRASGLRRREVCAGRCGPGRGFPRSPSQCTCRLRSAVAACGQGRGCDPRSYL